MSYERPETLMPLQLLSEFVRENSDASALVFALTAWVAPAVCRTAKPTAADTAAVMSARRRTGARLRSARVLLAHAASARTVSAVRSSWSHADGPCRPSIRDSFN